MGKGGVGRTESASVAEYSHVHDWTVLRSTQWCRTSKSAVLAISD